MSTSSTIKTPNPLKINEYRRPQRRFIPVARDPWRLPDEKIELPIPAQPPAAPPSLNLATTMLAPVILIGGTLIFSRFQTGGINWQLVGPMLIMSLGFPVASMISLVMQKKAYQKAAEARKQEYIKKLEEVQIAVQQTAKTQAEALQRVYPPGRELLRMAQLQGRLLWSRRQADDDFLAARFGEKPGPPSFSIELPRYSDPNETLLPLAQQLAGSFSLVQGLPALIEFSHVGSIVLTGQTSANVHGVARRIILDLIFHHSPKDFQLAVLADSDEAVHRWEWLKWVPHLEALDGAAKVQRLAFDPPKINQFVEWIHAEYENRRAHLNESGKRSPQSSIFVILDDLGEVRQHPDLALIADQGVTVGLYLLFVGGRNWPHECRARLELLDDTNFRLLETWTRDSRPVEGSFESVSIEDCLKVARALAGLQIGGAKTSIPLPPNIRISEVLGAENLTLDAVRRKWQVDFPAREQLQFPIGVRSRRDHLDMALLNLLPEKADGQDVGGYDAYHTILIGTTGSGKSEFMKSLVMGAALRYPPSLLNFFFLDFKGGAAFSVFENLPHVSGIVTNLSPELVERGLDSIRNEIDRRQEEFARARVRDIWEYNARSTGQPMPHMILFLDEFARGLADFPRLRETLDVLVRQGRSLGMYLVLANQDVSSEVDKLLNNVGWRIALKVAKREEMAAMIGRGYTMATRAGQGYLKRADEVVEFQAGYAGLPVRVDNASLEDELTIFEIDADGSFQKFFTKSNLPSLADEAKKAKQSSQKEEELIVDLLRQATEDLQIKPATKIYLDPLPKAINLEQVVEGSGIERRFQKDHWREGGGRNRLIAPIGDVDMPRACRQEQLIIDFEDQDGHLWIVGSAGSGKEQVLSSLLLTLAQVRSPEELHFYMLELGAGDLKQFESLPHTGAVIRPQTGERERFKRLLDHLETEMDRRTSGDSNFEQDSRSGLPSILLVVNNFAELRASFPDEAERLARFVRDGKRAGIHLIITTNRGTELTMSLRNNIARRLVLQLGSKDEHLELVGRELPQILAKINGRGYWVDGVPCECQIALPQEAPRAIIHRMDQSWKGNRPRKIGVLPACIPYEVFMDTLGFRGDRKRAILPVGQSYENLDGIVIDLDSDQLASQTWFILGAKESGKSNFLCCAALGVRDGSEPDSWEVRAYALRRSPLVNLGKENPEIQVFNTSESIVEDLNKLTVDIQTEARARGKRTLLLIDDLGATFQLGREPVAAALNQLAGQMEHADNVILMAAGMLDELRMQISAPIIKLLKQSRMGMVFSKDSSDMDWLSAQLSLEQRKFDLHPGRGFFVSRGKPQLVQTPFMGTCPEK